MTDLTLSVVSIDSLSPGQPLVARFDRSGGTIGRDESNTLALPDKHRRVSRLHGTISFVDGAATLTNSSTSLPIMVGEMQLNYGESVRLSEGLQFELGPYAVVASVGGAKPAVASPLIADPFAAVPAAAGERSSAVGITAAAGVAAMPGLGAHSVNATSAPPMPLQAAPAALVQPQNVDPLAALTSPISGRNVSGSVEKSLFSAQPNNAPDPLIALGAAAPADRLLNPIASPAVSSSGDPFADLLSGFGSGSGASAAPSTSDPFAFAASPAPISVAPSQPLLPAAGIGDDPLAAFASPLSMPPAVLPAAVIPSANLIPEDFNPFDLPTAAPRNSVDPLASLLGSAPAAAPESLNTDGGYAPAIDSLFPAQAVAQYDPLALPGQNQAHLLDGSIASLTQERGETDPLAMFSPGAALGVPQATPMRDDLLEIGAAFQPPKALNDSNLIPSPSPSSLDPLAGLLGGSSTLSPSAANPLDPFAGLLGSAAPLSPSASPSVAAAAFAGIPAAGLPVAPAPALRSSQAFPPPAAVPASPPVPRAYAQVMPAAAPAPSAPPDELAQAFLQGAGLQASALPHGLTAENMKTIGSLLRSATSGAIDMLAARAATKREVQANVTIIAVSANNPLKFLPNADAALQQLLGKKMPGFMRADIAMADAFNDLRAHEIGVIAGTRAALNEVLAKFDPQILAEKLTKGSVLESLMPSARKAKLWDQYLDRYEQIRREAEDDFQSIFGKAFVEAYELETQRIKSQGGEPK